MTDSNEDPFEKMGNDFLFQDTEEENKSKSKQKKRKPRKGKSNRNFWIAAGVILGMFVILLGILFALAFFILPKTQTERLQQAALINAHNTATVLAATNSGVLVAQVPTNTPMPTGTMTPTSTPVIVLFTETTQPTATQESGISAQAESSGQTATAAAILAQTSIAQTETAQASMPTATPTMTPTALPQTGIADEMNIPGLVGIALVLVMVIFLTRRVRLSI